MPRMGEKDSSRRGLDGVVLEKTTPVGAFEKSSVNRARRADSSMWCSRSDGDLATSSEKLGADKNVKKIGGSTSKLTPEILVTYARDLEERKTYEEKYREAFLGVFGTSKSFSHLHVPATVLKTDKEAVMREYNSDPCIAGLGLLG